MKSRIAAVLLCARQLAAGETPPVAPAADRAQLQGLAAVFEQAVRQAARPSFQFAGFDAPRSFYLPGVGAVIVLSPRALPMERVLLRRKVEGVPFEAALRDLEGRLAETRSPEVRQALQQSIDNLRRLQQLHVDERDQQARQVPRALALERSAERVALLPAPVIADLREFERQVLAMQEEAEQARREAEQRLEQLSHEVRLRLPTPAAVPEAPEAPRPPEAPVPPTPLAAAAASAPRAPAPWAFWFQAEELSEQPGRSAEATIADVRAALTLALEAQGARLTGLTPQEGIVVTVDLVGGGWPGRVAVRRTLVARAAKKDLDARAANKLTPEEFAKRVQLLEY